MKVLTPGHLYELTNFEQPDNPGQKLQFIEYFPKPDDSGKLLTLHDGTTNEDVLEMFIDRMNHLQARYPCDEYANAIWYMKQALKQLDKRTADRVKLMLKANTKPS